MNFKENMNYNERFERFHKLLGKLRKFIKTKERLGTMIDSSFSLKVYNIRRNKDIDLVLTVGTDYDGTKTTAKFDNGLLTLLIDKKINKKAKSLKISY